MLQCVGANKICLEREDARLRATAIKAKGLDRPQWKEEMKEQIHYLAL